MSLHTAANGSKGLLVEGGKGALISRPFSQDILHSVEGSGTQEQPDKHETKLPRSPTIVMKGATSAREVEVQALDQLSFLG